MCVTKRFLFKQLQIVKFIIKQSEQCAFIKKYGSNFFIILDIMEILTSIHYATNLSCT